MKTNLSGGEELSDANSHAALGGGVGLNKGKTGGEARRGRRRGEVSNDPPKTDGVRDRSSEVIHQAAGRWLPNNISRPTQYRTGFIQ